MNWSKVSWLSGWVITQLRMVRLQDVTSGPCMSERVYAILVSAEV